MAILTCLLYIRLAATLLRLCAIEILSINKPNGAGSLFHGTLVFQHIQYAQRSKVLENSLLDPKSQFLVFAKNNSRKFYQGDRSSVGGSTYPPVTCSYTFTFRWFLLLLPEACDFLICPHHCTFFTIPDVRNQICRHKAYSTHVECALVDNVQSFTRRCCNKTI